MKILHIVPTYLPAFRHGGPIESVHALNKALVALGIEVTVYTTDINGSERLSVSDGEERVLDGVRVRYFRSSLPRAWSYSRRMHRAIRDHLKDFDVVHITSVFLAASTLGAYYARKYHIPYLISPRGSLMREPLLLKSKLKKALYVSFIERRNLQYAAAIHFTVDREREEYVAAGLPLEKSVVIPNSIDIDGIPHVSRGGFRKKYGISEDVPIILSLGRLNWKKGFDTLIPAFARVYEAEPRALLVIGGEDEHGYKKEIERMITRAHMRGAVQFIGWVGGQEKYECYRDADIFVLPTYSENFGMSVVEAFAMKCPVVMSVGVGIAPHAESAKAALVVQKDTEAVARAILAILKDSDQGQKMTERAYAFVREHYAPLQVAQDFVKIYEGLVRSTQ